MTLTLRILNYDALENGGPLSITVHQSGCSVGRRASMDWVLPDPARHISGHHFDITWSGGAYWMNDVSKNGTFLQGSRYRLDGPHQLSGTDQLLVGHYMIGVEMAGAQPAARHGLQSPPMGGTSAPVSNEHDPWDFGPSGAFGAAAPTPAPTPPPRPSMDDMPQDFIPISQPAAPPQPAMPAPDMPEAPRPLQQPPAAAPDMPGGAATPPSFGAPGGPPPSIAPPSAMPNQAPDQSPSGQTPSGPPPSIAPPAPGPYQAPQPPAQPAAPSSPDGADLFKAFCDGAGIDPQIAPNTDPEALAHMLGQCMRVTTEEVMSMLRDRASVKQFTRGGERTMRSATGNNPLKFMPDPTQALETLLVTHKDGFMTGSEGFENALADLRRHQGAVFAALQPALARVLEGLSPEEIEAAAEGGLLGSSKRGKAWDTFVERWDAKADSGENGMLDAFLEAFATAYAKASGSDGSGNTGP